MKPVEISETMPVTQPNELSSDTQAEEANCPGLPPALFSEKQIKLFERQYENGYNIYDDQIYASWLQQKHPNDLPENLSLSTNTKEQVHEEQTEPLNCNTSTEDDNTSYKENTVPSTEQPTYSLSASLANTRVFVTELSKILNERKVVPKASSTVRMLTSAESLAL